MNDAVTDSTSMHDASTMIEASGLCKYYGEFAAVEDISLSVPAGQVCAFLGPNGAGKSTTMKMLTGYLSPNAGTARIVGHDVHNDRIAAAQHLGYLPEKRSVVLRDDAARISEIRGAQPE